MRGDDARLLDMLIAARQAAAFAVDSTFHDFERDQMRQMAILKAVEIVGEAATHLGVRYERHIRKSRGTRSSARAIVLFTSISISTFA